MTEIEKLARELHKNFNLVFFDCPDEKSYKSIFSVRRAGYERLAGWMTQYVCLQESKIRVRGDIIFFPAGMKIGGTWFADIGRRIAEMGAGKQVEIVIREVKK